MSMESAKRAKTAQLNLRVSADLKSEFAERCRRNGHGQTEIIEVLLSIWMMNEKELGIRHLDGSECPLSQLVRGLAEATKNELTHVRPKGNQ